ncbi:MAG: ABC transporter substrate-binding protein, partial [Anaerolineales bacterium]|nr:ABC transporter substrate-binding protein [Anaerolineales bacterium]
DGAEIRLERNAYYRTDSGAPAFDSLVFRFVEPGSSALEQLQTGECDVLEEALLPSVEVASLISRAEAGDYELTGVPGPAVERLDFNLQPVEGQSLFEDVRTRRGLAACLNRNEIAEGVAGGYTAVPATYLPISHPLYVPGDDPVAFDPVLAERDLKEAGWVLAEQGAEVRTASGVEGVPDGTPLAFDLYVLQGALSEQVGAEVVADMQACGADVALQPLPAEELFAGWPDGPVFGRRFGAVVWAWPAFASPSCEMFAGWEVPSDERPLGINASGYTGSAYAAACRSMLLSPPDAPAFNEAVRTIQSEFVGDVPGVPIYQRPRLLAHAAWLCEVEIDASAVTAYRTIERWRPCPVDGPGSQ